MFFVPSVGVLALVLAALGIGYVRARGLNDAGGWALLWLGKWYLY